MLYCLKNLNASATGTACENMFLPNIIITFIIQDDKQVKLCDMCLTSATILISNGYSLILLFFFLSF